MSETELLRLNGRATLFLCRESLNGSKTIVTNSYMMKQTPKKIVTI